MAAEVSSARLPGHRTTTSTLMERELYRIDQLPVLQNRMHDSAAAARSCPRGDMRLVQDERSGLVYNAAFRPELVTYDANYQNEQAVSPSFRQHLEFVVGVVERTMGRAGLVEVGCGKGYFLEMLEGRGFEITGFDPTYEGNNPKILRHFFAPGVGITAKALVLRHVLEHIRNPLDFLAALKAANGGTGLIYIEVPCFDWICERRAWFDVFYEHVNYFRLGDFERMFGRVIEGGRLFGDQYLYVVADLATLREPRASARDEARLPDDFLATLDRPVPGTQGTVAVWGGASKGVIFALLKERRGQPVKLVIDINPAKQGKYLPGTGLRVHAPEEALAKMPRGSTLYVMNSNYLAEIRDMTRNAYHYTGVDRE